MNARMHAALYLSIYLYLSLSIYLSISIYLYLSIYLSLHYAQKQNLMCPRVFPDKFGHEAARASRSSCAACSRPQRCLDEREDGS
jgi:hypothetical protein